MVKGNRIKVRFKLKDCYKTRYSGETGVIIYLHSFLSCYKFVVNFDNHGYMGFRENELEVLK